jgi:LysM repeat protein
MKFKLLLLTLTLLTFTISAFARPVVDSVGVENHKGKRVVVYKIKKKDTYYSIAHKYHIPVGDLQSYNDNAKMTIGHTIKVPTGKPFIEPKKHKEEKEIAADKKHKKKGHHEEEQQADDQQTDNTPAQQQAAVQQPVQQQPQAQPADTPPAGPPTQYKVSAGETLYSIAKRFNTTVDNIMKLNNMQSNTIQPGQLLNVRANAPATPPQPAPVVAHNSDSVVAKRDSTVVVSHQDSANATVFHANANKFGIFEKDEKGVATWMDDDSLDPNKKLVLHRTAPIGTVIRITNPMTNRTTFAKVVGRFTDNEQTKDVIIVMTKNVAQSLGALDKRFQVSLSYGVPNEQ